MASSDRELEEQLLEAGNRLLDPPPSVEELLPLLNQIENCLSRVEQSPSKSMQSALSPSQKALVADQLLRHSNPDVKVAVASCISEITRITAPEAPYDDEQMKDVFQLIVSSFENLSDKSSQSYSKRAWILETVAKVRSCVVMLDLECDALILEMFQHFLKSIRDYHPENVFSSMETIMSLVLEESEDVPMDLLSVILASVKKGSEDVLPIARKLGERVLENCADKVRPYLIQAVKNLGIALDEYSRVVAYICQEASGSVEKSDHDATGEIMADESESAKTSEANLDTEKPAEEALPEKVDSDTVKSPKLCMSNGTVQTGDDDTVADTENPEKKEGEENDQSKCDNVQSNTDGGDLDSKVVTEENPEQDTQRQGMESNSSLKSSEPVERLDDKKDSDSQQDDKNLGEDIPSSLHKISAVEASDSEAKMEADANSSSPKAPENESSKVPSPAQVASVPEENRPKRPGRPRKKVATRKEAVLSLTNTSKKVSEGTKETDMKLDEPSGKSSPLISDDKEKTPTAEVSKKKGDNASDSEGKTLPVLAKKVDGRRKDGAGSSLRQSEDKKSVGLGKDAKDDNKEILSSLRSASKSTKDEDDSEKRRRSTTKRKYTSSREKDSEEEDLGANLVGSKIKVWWPLDQTYYEGVVDSFDRQKKKHKVLYADGDVEVLNLRRQKWELIDGSSVAGQGKAKESADQQSDGSIDESQKKKAKASADESTEQGKADASAKKGGVASSSKSKGGGTESGRSSKDGNKSDGKARDKSAGKSVPESSGKSKSSDAATPKTAAKVKSDGDAAPKTKTKDEDAGTGTPKASTKSKPDLSKAAGKAKEAPKTGSAPRGRPPKSGSKSEANGGSKVKSGSSQLKESGNSKENSSESPKVAESSKGKSSTKAEGSDSKAGKKRKRGAKS